MGGVWTLFPLWTERDSFQSHSLKYQFNWKKGCERNLAFQEKKGGTQAYSLLPASVLYLREGAGGGGSLFPLWTEIDGFQSHSPKWQFNWINSCEGNLAFHEKKEGTQAYSQLPASVLYLQEGAGGGRTLFPLWTERDCFQGGSPK